MRHSILFTALISVISVAPLRGDDGLFSEVAMESVFQTSTSAEPVASKNLSGSVDRVTGVSSLVGALNAAGFEAKETKGRATFTLNHASWKFPVSMEVHIDQDRLDCRISLIKLGDAGQVSAQRLLSLLESGDERGASFSYDSAAKTIQVRASLSNRSITAADLKADLVRMAGFAEKHADLWSNLAAPAKSTADTATTSKPESASAAETQLASTSPSPLTGRWSAALGSNEAFAIAITSDSRFQLVHLKSGKSTVSKGKIKRSGNQMTLVGDGDLTLNCKVSQTTGDAFALAIQGAGGKVAMTLNFKKAK